MWLEPGETGVVAVALTGGAQVLGKVVVVDPTIVALISELSTIAARNLTSTVSERVKVIRASKKDEQIISSLDEIINELLDDKAQLTRVAQGLRDELVGQQISNDDVEFIAGTIVPALEKLSKASDQGLSEDVLDTVKTLLKPEMFMVLQLLGFDFRSAIGKPLTDLLRRVILRSVPDADSPNELQLEMIRNQRVLAELSKDPEAFSRFRTLMGGGGQ